VNAVFLPVILISGVFYDAHHAPGFIRGIAQALPLTHLIDGLSGAMVKGTSIADNISALGVIAAWGVFGIALAVRGFSWEQHRG
jgi:ABC-2 type transport system permease protein